MRIGSVRSLFCLVLLAACSHDAAQDETNLGAGFNQASGSGFDAPASVVVPANDGSGAIYVGGAFTSYNGNATNFMVRLNGTGTIDAGFSVGTGFNSDVTSIAALNDGSGRIYVGGSFTAYNGTIANRLVRLNLNGTLDANFSTGTGFDGAVMGLAPTGDGSGAVYVAGGFTTYNGSAANRIVRLDTNGNVDSGFASGSGFGGTPFGIPQAIALANDGSGSVYVGGTFTAYNGASTRSIVRLMSGGSLDSGFVPSGFSGSGNVSSIAPANDGSGDVYVGGLFSGEIERLKTDGSVNTRFFVGFGFDNIVFTIAPAIDGSGDVYVGGTFTAYNGTVANHAARLHADGTVAVSFSTGNGFDNVVVGIATANDGSGDAFVAGAFTSYNGTTVSRIVRLNPDGTLD